MIKIGIVGSDNSHALNFSKLVNLSGDKAYENVKITHIFGLDKAQTELVARDGGIENIVENHLDMLDKVDAVMVVFRDGALHFSYAMPFIKAGLAVWVDKPIAIDTDEAKLMVIEAEKSGCVLSGGSCTKLVPDIIKVKEFAANHKVKMGMLNFPIYLDSPYSKIHFYAAHLVEMVTEVFGFDIRSVYAHRNGDNLSVICSYDDFDFVFAFVQMAGKFGFNIISETENFNLNIDISPLTKCGMDDFLSSIYANKTSHPSENLWKVSNIVNAIDKSMKLNLQVLL